MKNQESIVHVNMLGGFSISMGDRTIVDQNNQAKKPWSLLEYLITFRGRDIPVEELIDLFWKDEASNNPAGALKTLMFRVRKLLEPLGYPTQELVFQNRKAYGWTKDLITVCDTDQFEDLCAQLEAHGLSEDDRLAFVWRPLPCTRETFFQNQSGNPGWYRSTLIITPFIKN